MVCQALLYVTLVKHAAAGTLFTSVVHIMTCMVSVKLQPPQLLPRDWSASCFAPCQSQGHSSPQLPPPARPTARCNCPAGALPSVRCTSCLPSPRRGLHIILHYYPLHPPRLLNLAASERLRPACCPRLWPAAAAGHGCPCDASGHGHAGLDRWPRSAPRVHLHLHHQHLHAGWGV